MLRFLLGKPGIRWQFELRAIPVKRAEPDAGSGVYDCWMAEVGAYDGDSAGSGDSSANSGGWDAAGAW